MFRFDPDEFFLNALANFFSAGVIALVALAAIYIARRRGMRSFFGFQLGRQDVLIYLSSIAVNKGGSKGTGGIVEGFHGDAITEVEYRAAISLANTIRSGVFSRVLTATLGDRGTGDAVAATVERSPSVRGMARDEEDNVCPDWDVVESLKSKSASVVLVGGPIYNLYTDRVLQWVSEHRTKNRFEFLRYNTEDGTSVRGIRAIMEGEPESWLRKELPDRVVDYFIIQKVRIGTTTVFICAGTCTAATAAAVQKLETWRRWRRHYGARSEFGRLYQIALPKAGGEGASAEVREAVPERRPAFKCEYPQVEARGRERFR